MQSFKELLQNYKIDDSKVLYPRQELIKKFVDRLNASRIGKYPPLKAGFVASRMYRAGLKDDMDLNWFYGYCDDAKNFSSCWWWSLKAQ